MKIVTITKKYEFEDNISDYDCCRAAIEILFQDEIDDIDIKIIDDDKYNNENK